MTKVLTRGNGSRNIAIYPPNTRCDAHPGSPVFPDHWAIVWWLPSMPNGNTSIEVAASKEDAIKHVEKIIGPGNWAESGEASLHVCSGRAYPGIVRVYNWNAAHYGGSEPTGDPFLVEVIDQRQQNGQVFVDVAVESGNIDDVMYLNVEINRLPGSNDDVQCAHVAFDADNMAFSLFKQGRAYVLRPEFGVDLVPMALPDGTPAFRVQGQQQECVETAEVDAEVSGASA